MSCRKSFSRRESRSRAIGGRKEVLLSLLSLALSVFGVDLIDWLSEDEVDG